MGAMLTPGPVTSVPLVSGLVGGSQVQSKAQVAPQEEAQHDDKAQHEDNPREGNEQVLGAEKKQHVRQPGWDIRKGCTLQLQPSLQTLESCPPSSPTCIHI